jgi:AcrR family transcriptional regulator
MSTPAGQRLSPKGLAVRERLLQATEKLLAERGYEGTTVQLVSDAAEVSRNQFFHHFGSKEALCLAALERVRRSWRNEISGPAAGFVPPARVPYLLTRLAELEPGDGLGLRLLVALVPVQPYLPGKLRDELAGMLDEQVEFWRDTFKSHRKAVNAAGMPKPREAARLVVATLLGSAGLRAGAEAPEAGSVTALIEWLAGNPPSS